MQATTNLFEDALSPSMGLAPCLSFHCAPCSAAWSEGKTIRRAALTTSLRKFKGPGAYEGLWELLLLAPTERWQTGRRCRLQLVTSLRLIGWS